MPTWEVFWVIPVVLSNLASPHPERFARKEEKKCDGIDHSYWDHFLSMQIIPLEIISGVCILTSVDSGPNFPQALGRKKNLLQGQILMVHRFFLPHAS